MAKLPKGFVPDTGLPEGFVPDEEASSLSPEDQKRLERMRGGLKNQGQLEQMSQERVTPVSEQIGQTAPGAINSAADRYSMGLYGGGLRALGSITESLGRTPPEFVTAPLESIDRYRREHPTASQYTDMPGYMSGAPKMLATGIERAIPAVSNPAAQAARAILGSGLTSGTIAGSESAIRGDEPMEVAKEAGRGYLGGTMVGAPLSAGALVARGAAGMVLGSKGAKAREYLTSRGQPLTAPDTSDAAIGAAAQRTDDAVKDAMVGYKKKVASGPYMEAINEITPEQAGGLMEISPIYHDLSKAAQDPGNLQVVDKLTALMKMLENRQVTLADGSKAIFMTEEQLNGLRRSMGGIAGVGETTAAKNAPLRAAYDQVKALVDEGPYAEANRRNTAGMKDLNESLDMVGLDTSTNPEQPITGNLRVASQRQGQNTVTAGADTERLNIEAFKAKHPELANTIDAPEILRRQGDIAFHTGAPGHGGFIERIGLHLSLPAAAAVAMMGHGWKGAATVPLMMALQNRNALAGRYLYNPAQSAQAGAQMFLGEVPQLAAPGRELLQERR